MRRSRGFTLIEVMIALVLMSMMMVGVVTAMRTFGNTKATITRVTERVDDVRTVSQFLRRSIGSAMPVLRQGGVEADSYSGTYFLGDSSQMTWVAPVLAGSELGGSYIFSLSQVGDNLALSWRPYQFDLLDINETEHEQRVLLEELEEFEIGYLPNYNEDWLAEWPGLPLIPLAVRLSLKVEGKYWPELVIRLSGAQLNDK